MIKAKNFGAANELQAASVKLQVIGAVSNNCHAELVSASDQYGVNANFQTKKTLKQVQGDSEWDAKGNEKSEINVKEHPNIFNSQLSIFNSEKRYGFTLDEDTEIISEDVSLSPLAGSKIASADVSLSPLRGKYPPEAGERGLKMGLKRECQGLKRGFTLAEVLITLVVIGVVAAITIPVLHSNTSGKEWNAAKQKARAGMGEAFKLASVNNDLPDISAKEFVKTVLPKYLKLAKTCDTAQECGFPDKIKNVDGTSTTLPTAAGGWKWNTYTRAGANDMVWNGNTANANWNYARRGISSAENTDAAFFRTVDGFSAAMMYNPNCAVDQLDKAVFDFGIEGSERAFAADQLAGQQSRDVTCFNAVYDMNGQKGPNTVGKDIGFVGSFYTGINARSAAVLPVQNNTAAKNWTNASQYCKNLAPAGDYDLPTIDELTLIYLNDKLAAGSSAVAGCFWSRSAAGGKASYFRSVDFGDGAPTFDHGSRSNYVRCVRADKLM